MSLRSFEPDFQGFMRSFFNFQKIALWLLAFVFSASCVSIQAETLTDAPKGMQELKEFHKPVALFVPEDYKKSKNRSLLIVIPSTSDYSKAILDWTDLAKTKNFVVACPSIVVRDEDVPYKTDEWIVNLKNELMTRYGADRAYLAGIGASSNYAAYLGLKQPQEFDAVASVGGSWTGPFEKLTQLTDDAANQTPFYIALNESDERVAPTQEKVKEMTAKGYHVRLVMLNVKGEEATDGFRSGIIRWFDEQAAKTAALQSAGKGKKKTFKQKLAQVKEDFFRV